MTDQAALQRRVLVATCLGHAMTHLYMLVFPALVTPLRAELGLSLDDALELSFFGYLLYGLGSVPAGIITDRWSARWMLCLCLGLAGLGSLLAGLSTSVPMLVVALALVGLGASIYHPTGMALLSRTFTERRGRALGTNGVWGNVGLASAPFITGLLAGTAGWRSAYLVLSVPGLVGAAWVATLPLDEAEVEERVVAAAREDEGALRRFFLVLCVAMTLGGLAYRTSSVIFPTYFEAKTTFLEPLAGQLLGWFDATGAKTAAATTLTSLVYVVGIVGQMLGGRFADRFELRLGYVLFHLATLPAVFAVAALTELPLFGAAMVYLLFALGMQPIENSLVAKLTPAAWRSTAYGLKFILTFGVGALAVPLVGKVVDAAGLSAVFQLVAAFEIGIVVVATTLWWRSRRALPSLTNAIDVSRVSAAPAE